MSITARDADASEAGKCMACTCQVRGPAGYVSGRVRVVVLTTRGNGGIEVRLCAACRTTMREALR